MGGVATHHLRNYLLAKDAGALWTGSDYPIVLQEALGAPCNT